MALAVALVACQGAAGVDGKDAATPKLAPFKVGTIPAMTLEAGKTGTVDLSGYFSDPEGKTLTYTAVSDMPKYATVAPPKDAMLTVTAVAAGKSTITVTATDPDKRMATQKFMVTVTKAATTPTAYANRWPRGCRNDPGESDCWWYSSRDPTGREVHGFYRASADADLYGHLVNDDDSDCSIGLGHGSDQGDDHGRGRWFGNGDIDGY